MRQEKLQKFTEETRAARASLTSPSLPSSHSLSSSCERGDIDAAALVLSHSLKREGLSEFKRRFEKEHPEKAEALRQAIMPEDEKKQEKALKLVAEYERLREIVDQGGRSSSLAKDYIKTLSHKMAREKEVMAYVQENHQVIAKEIEEQVKVLQRERSLGRARGL